MTARLAGRALAACLVSLAAGGVASAQSLVPMRGEVASVADRFALRLLTINYLDTPQVFTMKVFDTDWNEIHDAGLSARKLRINPEASQTVFVTIPFGELTEREVLVCSETEPFRVNEYGAIKGQVCGRYTGRRYSP